MREPHGAPWPAALLVVLVHVEALWLDPALCAKCLWWRIVGKRLRARLMLAPLLGRTRHAYDLWLARQGACNTLADPIDAATIIALIEEGEGVEATLASLAAACLDFGTPLLVAGGDVGLGDRRVRRVLRLDGGDDRRVAQPLLELGVDEFGDRSDMRFLRTGRRYPQATGHGQRKNMRKDVRFLHLDFTPVRFSDSRLWCNDCSAVSVCISDHHRRS